MFGKKKCNILREIRKKIAKENDIPYETEDCTYKGECEGTCPKCDQELDYLESQLEERRQNGQSANVPDVPVWTMTDGMRQAAMQSPDGGILQQNSLGTYPLGGQIPYFPKTAPEPDPEEHILVGIAPYTPPKAKKNEK